MQAKHTQYYANADDFFELFEENDFDKQMVSGRLWLGLVANENGKLETTAKFVFDDVRERKSGTGYIA